MILVYETDRGIIEVEVADSKRPNEPTLQHYAYFIKRFMSVRSISKSFVKESL
jgi:hypothetical protein